MKYSKTQIDGIRDFIENISVTDLLNSHEIASAMSVTLSKKLESILEEDGQRPINVNKHLKNVMEIAANCSYSTVKEIQSDTRQQDTVTARKIIVWYMRRFYGLSDNEISKWINKHRTVAVFYMRNIDDEYKNNKRFAEAMNRFCSTMKIEYAND